jgi:hypothetical protein
MPLSGFALDVALIAFPIPVAINRALDSAFTSRESLFRSRGENGPDSDVESQSRRKPQIRSGSMRRFRRLFLPVQSTVLSKLYN